MCKKIITLAHNDYQQIIAVCEHGMVHLTHEFMTIYVRLSTFEIIAEKLSQNRSPTEAIEGIWSLTETDDGQMELWIGSGGLRFKFLSFVAFANLVTEAHRKLKTLSPLMMTLHSDNDQQQSKFSLN